MTHCLDIQSSSIIRIDLQAFLTILNSYLIHVKLNPLDPGQVLIHSFYWFELQNFEIVFLSFEVLCRIVVGVSETKVDLIPLWQGIEEVFVVFVDVLDSGSFGVLLHHENDA